MLALRLLRSWARRMDRALRDRAPRAYAARTRAVARRPRLAFESLETRDMLAASVGAAMLPMPLPADYGQNADAAPQHAQSNGHANHAAAVNIAVAEDEDYAQPAVAVASEVRVIVVIYVQPQVLEHAIEAWVHESERLSVVDHPAVAETLAGDIANSARASLGAAEPPSIGPAHANAIAAALPVDVARAGSPVAPALLTPPAPMTVNLSLPALDNSAPAIRLTGATDFQLPASAGAFVAGVPGPARVPIANNPSAFISARTSSAEPAGVPWLAGLLTPVTHLEITEPLFALEHFVDAAQSLSQTLTSKVASILTSPWMAGAAVALAAIDVCRRRARRTASTMNAANDVPDISRPSQLI